MSEGVLDLGHRLAAVEVVNNCEASHLLGALSDCEAANFASELIVLSGVCGGEEEE